MKNTCPACHSQLDFKPWDGELASFEICPHCGMQFGYTDTAGGSLEKRNKLYVLWYEEWMANDKTLLSKEKQREVISKAINS